MWRLRLLIPLPSFRTSVVPPSTGVLFSFPKTALPTPFFMLQYRQIHCLMLGSDSLTEVAYGARSSYKIPLPVGKRAFQIVRQTPGLFQSVFFCSAQSNCRHRRRKRFRKIHLALHSCRSAAPGCRSDFFRSGQSSHASKTVLNFCRICPAG